MSIVDEHLQKHVHADQPEHGQEHGHEQAHGHSQMESHHRHSHAQTSRHDQGHHLLQVSNLSVGFRMYQPAQSLVAAQHGMSSVIYDLSISVHAGEIVAVVGASGSGKTILADSILGLYEPNAEVRGTIWFDGKRMTAADLAQVRGRGISLVPQSVSHLDPLMRVGKQVRGWSQKAANSARNTTSDRGTASARGTASETVAMTSGDCAVDRSAKAGRDAQDDRTARRARQKALFKRYGLSPETERLYPHELSGGMARRVLLCCALMDNPKLIVADEPTPGLDLDLAITALQDFRAFADEGGGVMLITHDIELALKVADRVAVFKDGTIVEETSVSSFASPDLLKHPFSRALWHALPEHGFMAESSLSNNERNVNDTTHTNVNALQDSRTRNAKKESGRVC